MAVFDFRLAAKMNKFKALLFLILCSVLSQAQTTQAKNLKMALKQLQEQDNLQHQQIYFDQFPGSIQEFKALFGYENNEAAPLYDGFEYVQKFFQLDSISQSLQMKKWIAISIDAYWEADAVNYFQNSMIPKILGNVKLAYALLKKRSDKEITSFFYFFFDEPHPRYTTIPVEFAEFKEHDEAFYTLIINQHAKAIKSNKH